MRQVETHAHRLGGLAIAALVTLTAACGESSPSDVENEPVTAAVTGVVHDSAAVLPPGRTSMAPADSTDYDGVANGSAQIEVFSEGGGWVSLGEASAVTFDIYCEEAAVVQGDVQIEVGTYTKVRLTLTEFQTNILAGAVIQATTYGDPFTVDFGTADPVVIEKSVDPFTLEEGSTTMIRFDLNTELWLDEIVVGEGLVPAAEVQSATNVLVVQ